MKAFAAVLGRELAERRLLLLASLLLGLIPLAGPWIPGLRPGPVDELRADIALSLAVILAAVLTILLGGAVIARDLAERRLGFYFCRPIPGWSLWAGKLASALVLIVAAVSLVLIPTGLTGAKLSWPSWSEAVGAGFGLRGGLLPAGVALLLLLLSAHAASVLVRIRSTWLVLDLIALPCSWILFANAIGGLTRAGAVGAAQIASRLCLLCLLVALAVASGAQILLGRTDSRSAHRWLSLGLWSVLLLGLGGIQGYSQWVRTPKPRDLDEIFGVLTARSGTWAVVQGKDEQRGGYTPAFLIETTSGRFLRLPGRHGIVGLGFDGPQPVFSLDGRWAVWVDSAEKDSSTFDVVRVDLRVPRPQPATTEVSYAAVPRNLALSPDDRLVAAILRDRLLVHDLASGRLLATVRLPRETAVDVWCGFDAHGVLRLYQSEPGPLGFRFGLQIWELVPGSFQLQPVGRIVDSVGWQLVSNRDHSRFLDPVRGLRLLDARTGAVLATAELNPGDRSLYAGFLSDGRVAWTVETATGRDLRLLSADLAEIRRFSFPGARGLGLGGEPSPGQLVVGVDPRRSPEVSADSAIVLLQLDSGARRTLARGAWPLQPYGQISAGAPAHLFLVGSRLQWIDFDTGRRRTLAGPGT